MGKLYAIAGVSVAIVILAVAAYIGHLRRENADLERVNSAYQTTLETLNKTHAAQIAAVEKEAKDATDREAALAEILYGIGESDDVTPLPSIIQQTVNRVYGVTP